MGVACVPEGNHFFQIEQVFSLVGRDPRLRDADAQQNINHAAIFVVARRELDTELGECRLDLFLKCCGMLARCQKAVIDRKIPIPLQSALGDEGCIIADGAKLH